MSIRALGPRAPPPAPRSPSTAALGDTAQRTPQARGRPAPGRCVLSSATSAPPPPAGATARAEPDGHPGTGARRANRTSLEPGDRGCPPPRGTLGAPLDHRARPRRGLPALSWLALRGQSARPSAPLEVPELAGTPLPWAPRWYGPPPFKGSALGRLSLQSRRASARSGDPCARAETSASWSRGVVRGGDSPTPPSLFCHCGTCHRKHQRSASNTALTLLSVLSLVLRDKCLQNDFPSWGSIRITQKTTIRGSPLVN